MVEHERAGTAFRSGIVFGLGLLCASCGTQPVHYEGLASAAQLHASTGGGDRRIIFNTDLDPAKLKSYSAILLEPVQIYHGPDQQFGSLDDNAKQDLARHAETKFRAELAQRQMLADAAGNDVLRMRVTITGADKSVPVLSTVTKVTPVGLALSGVRAATGRAGSFNGAVLYAVELFNSIDGKLVYAFVTRQYPNALNIPASILPLDAAKAGIDHGASATATLLKGLMMPRVAG